MHFSYDSHRQSKSCRHALLLLGLETLDTSTESETTYSPQTQLRDGLASPASRHPMHVTGVSVHTSDKAARDTLKTASTL